MMSDALYGRACVLPSWLALAQLALHGALTGRSAEFCRDVAGELQGRLALLDDALAAWLHLQGRWRLAVVLAGAIAARLARGAPAVPEDEVCQ